MKRLLYIAILFLVVACSSPVPEIEVVVHECAAPIEGRAVTMCFEADSIIYFVGGRIQDGSYPDYMLRYDARSNQWSKSGAIPITPRVNGTACVTSQGVFLGLGYSGAPIDADSAYLRDWWLFEPQLNRWTQKAEFPTDQTVAAVSWTDNNYVWVDFGFRGFNNNLWRYDITTDTWAKQEQTGSIPDRLMSTVAAQCGNRYFAGTGFRRVSRSGWWEWFTDGHWEQRASVPGNGRHNAACAATENAVWVMGGWHYGDTLTTGFFYDDILRYTPETNQWAYCGAIPCGTMENGAACAIDKRLYFGLGEDKHQKLHSHWYYIDE